MPAGSLSSEPASMSVAMIPACTTFTVIFPGPRSRATPLEYPMRAALVPA